MSEIEYQSGEKAACPECAARAEGTQAEQFVYAIGKLDCRFPSIGVEREFQQRERAYALKQQLPDGRGERLKVVAEANPHLWSRLCFVLSIGNVPTYIVTPSSQHTLRVMLEAVARSNHPESFVILIGRRMGTARPGQCGGLLAPIVLCDLLYASRVEEWVGELSTRAEEVLKDKKLDARRFTTVAREFFDQVVNSTENIGGLDTHRALNYVLVQHAGLALSVAERPKAVLDRIETRPIQGTDLRRIVAVILTFVDRMTGVPERLFCRVDVTEEWPFLLGSGDTSAPGLGLQPYVDNGLLGVSY